MSCNKPLLLLLLLLTACAAEKEPIPDIQTTLTSQSASTHGQAVIGDTGLERARQAAINDAIFNLSAQLKQSGATTQSADIKIVDEWQQDGSFHVQAVAVLDDKAQECRPTYRKRLLATAFPAMNTEQISGADSQDLYSGIPREIGNRLMEGGDFIVRNLSNVSLYQNPKLAPEVTRPDLSSGPPVLQVLAKQQNVQFILAGVIRDFKIESGEYVRGSGILAFLKSSVRDFVARRSIGIDVYVYDGFTGAVLFQQRYSDSILGDVSLPAGYSVGSDRFLATPAGHKISKIIAQATTDIQQFLACYPLAVRVAEVDQRRIVIAAGAQDKIRIGDKFMLYRAAEPASSGLGFNQPSGILVIREVGASMAAGQLEGEFSSGLIRAGDWARSLVTQ